MAPLIFTRSRRAVAIAAAGTALAVIASGCTASGGSNGTTEISFLYATANNAESPYEVLAKAYEKENPNVQIKLNPQPNDSYAQVLRTQLQGGSASDIVLTAPGQGEGNSILPLAEASFLEPLDSTLEKSVPTGSDALFSRDGKIYGLPMGITVSGLVVSRAAMAAKGVSDFPADTGALLSDCKTLTASGTSFIALAGAAAPNTGLTAMTIAASRVYKTDPDWNTQRADGKVKFADSDGWRDTLQTIIDLKKAGCFQPGAEGAGFDAITKGLSSGSTLGSVIPGASASEIAQTAPQADFQIHAFPTKAGGDFGVVNSGYALSLNAASKQKDAAAAFLAWVAKPEQAKLFADASGVLPTVGYDKLDLSNTIYAPVQDMLRTGAFTGPANATWPNAAVFDALASGVQGLLTGQMSVDQVLTAMDAAWDS